MSLLSPTGGSLVWEWLDGSYDRAKVLPATNGWEISGRHGDTRYVIAVSADFICLSLDASCGSETLSLRHTPDGWRNATKGLIPGSTDIHDLDLGWSALTNTFPIRRLQAKGIVEGTFDVLMITEPDLKPQIVRQSYRQLADTWLYTNLDNGFSAKLSVDVDGLVTDYPGLCSHKDVSA